MQGVKESAATDASQARCLAEQLEAAAEKKERSKRFVLPTSTVRCEDALPADSILQAAERHVEHTSLNHARLVLPASIPTLEPVTATAHQHA